MIGTNLIAIGVPAGGREVFMMDTATSVVSMGEIHERANRMDSIPFGWALDSGGRPTEDPEAAKEGALAPFGGPKGYALGLGLELLVSGLAGAAIGRDVTGTLDDDQVCNKADLFILIDRPAFDLRSYLAVDPSTGEEIGYVSDGSVEDGIDAVTAAAQAMPGWAATAPRARSEILRRCFDLMIERKEELARLISLENGKSLADAQGEVSYAAEFFRWFAEEAVRLNGELYPAPGGANKIMMSHRPSGVSLLITPWNFPAAMATRKIAPALAAGCACVLKPATETPLTAYVLVDILKEAGVPDGVVNLVTTRRAGKVVSAMLHDPRVRKLSFTGSTEVGRKLLHEAADTIVSCSMELGGNAPFLVFEDADIDSAVDGAMIAKMRNGGEACTAANRFLVHEAVADRFARALADRMAALKVGSGFEIGTECGPLINRDAVERLTGLVEEAKARGAKVLCGDHLVEGRGFFFPPTVLVDVPEAATITNSEIFGPIAANSTFSTEEEAIRKANDTEYGLISYVFTGDLSRGLRVCDQMESGMVGLYRGLVSDPAAPFGGAKQSGIGREGAHMGILEFSEVRYVAATW